ncbi:DddA-like double-stranded DNA deaminase toxin [Actinokineospora sp.]|uniref:DddA-like double-stranded DNA deaminase toxin n=1 Tax=Actinokineospora sp. TaxID=1872133 RepID=UPI0040383595
MQGGSRTHAGSESTQERPIDTTFFGGIANRHGDRYPPDAIPHFEDLPPRVRRGRRNSPMTGTGARSAQVIINHAPCGSEPGAIDGCDAVLPSFIPCGSQLTVLGTDAQGDPFHRTYKGKAVR